MPFLYEYTDEIPRDFPTLGLREVKKGDQIQSEEELNNPFLKQVTTSVQSKKGSE